MGIGGLKGWEFLIVAVLVLLLFGAKRLPEVARSLGQSVREFRKGIRDVKQEFNASIEEESSEPAKAAPKTVQAEKTA